MSNREAKIAHGLPSCALITAEASGGKIPYQIVQLGFGLPEVAFSLVNRRFIPSWAKDFARGGAIHRTQLSATDQNLAALRDAGIEKVIVHVRDPRQIILSLARCGNRHKTSPLDPRNGGHSNLDLEAKIDHEIEQTLQPYANWLKEWVNAAEVLDVRFLTSEQFATDREGYLDVLLDAYGGNRNLFQRKTVEQTFTAEHFQFCVGEIDVWRRDFFPSSDRARYRSYAKRIF